MPGCVNGTHNSTMPALRRVSGARARHARFRELFDHDHLWQLGQPAAAVACGPRRREIAVLSENLSPVLGELQRIIGVERTDSRPLVREMLGKERANLRAK